MDCPRCLKGLFRQEDARREIPFTKRFRASSVAERAQDPAWRFDSAHSGRRSSVVSVYRPLRDLDWPLLIVTLILCGLGVLQIYSATQDTRWADAWWKQIVWVATGLAMMWVVSMI